MTRRFLFLLPTFLVSLPLLAQPSRPVPYPVFTTPQFDQAVANGTRTTSGKPGPNYWTNYAEYEIDARLDPATQILEGSVSITYHNRSPYALRFLVLHLYQNIYKEGTVRNRNVDVTGGLTLKQVSARDSVLVERTQLNEKGYALNGTLMYVLPGSPVEPGASIDLDINWSFTVPASSFRNGTDGEVYYVAYWYPRMAVLDDVNGWETDPYMGNGEFYNGYGDYNVALTLPEGWLVGSTGTLMNPEEVLSEQTHTRLAAAATSRSITNIVTEDERTAGTSTAQGTNGLLTWRFNAQNVRDFAFGTSASYLWDAARIDLDRDGDGSNDPTMAHAFYRPDRGAWNRSAEFLQFSIEYLSERLLPYPWPQMTAVEGIISGGMEYPMITLIGGNRPSDRSLFGVTFHETAHMWFPMIVGQDENDFAWMDEGLTTFNTNDGSTAFFDDPGYWIPGRQAYYQIAGSGREVEPMRHADRYPINSPARGTASYSKPAVTLHALRGLVGEERFLEAYRAYAERWAYKHPTPFDLFNTFEDVLGEDLDWFWTPMLYETWTLDHSVQSVESVGEQIVVTIEDLGLTPMPATVRVTYADESTREQIIPVQTWLDGARKAELMFPAGSVQKVEIDPGQFLPDVDRDNNVWEVE